MTDLKLFHIEGEGARELRGEQVPVERHLQKLVERNMETLLGVRFLASEFSTGDQHGGRIDSLGLDEAGSPVIVEYKRARDQNVMNQALFYLSWLLDHRGDFHMLVDEVLGSETATAIDWSRPRMICVASDFTRYDAHAVRTLGHATDLVRYRVYRHDLLTLELIASSYGRRTGSRRSSAGRRHLSVAPDPASADNEGGASDHLRAVPERMRELFADLDATLIGLGEVRSEVLQTCVAYRRLRGFAWVRVQEKTLVVTLNVDPRLVDLRSGFTRDVRELGHHGGGHLEVRIRSHADLQEAAPLLRQSLEAA
ncbi:DUF5655 domain-containing protein [Streptomyces sp. NBC_01304]|uniref:DUF5655 domain-containing protein n=1 Tax=Streptomyces sp. NBC_01304 TaxID=2903818 RepID=UPI002E0DA059|nr:DUF5655 domain-containing protein [Streptomyces sp. NBC_01304]